ncbi:MAG: RidA family protein [Alphaproteobacteria bacterium]
MSVEPLLPVELGPGRIRYAQGMKAGRWVFATGIMAQDYGHGLSSNVLAENAPHAGLPKREKEAALIFEHLQRVLDAGGTTIENVVRTDQYYTTVEAVPPYQAQRHQVLKSIIPPSTSIVQTHLGLPGADINLQAIGAVPSDGFTPEHLRHDHIKAMNTSGYSPALTVGDYVFIPGCTAMSMADEPQRNGVAAAARMPEGMQWGGQPIKLETDFIVTERLVPSLALAGATLNDVAKAQVYLTDPRDYSAFNEAWRKHFHDSGPALTVVSCAPRALAPYDGHIEINILALKTGAGTERQEIDAGIVPGLRDQAQAVRVGDLLLISGLMATDRYGALADGCGTDPRQPFYGSSAERQAERIVDHVEALCEAAGTSLSNAVRIQQFHTDISEIYDVYKVCERRLDGAPVPFGAVEVPTPLAVPGASVLMDVWVYAP